MKVKTANVRYINETRWFT